MSLLGRLQNPPVPDEESSEIKSIDNADLLRELRHHTSLLKKQMAKQNRYIVAHSLIGLQISCVLVSIWVFYYLSTTSAGRYGSSMLNFFLGSSIGSSVFESTEPLFVVVTRFLVGVGLLWGPMTLLVRLLRGSLDENVDR